jgi:hypothetical protein
MSPTTQQSAAPAEAAPAEGAYAPPKPEPSPQEAFRSVAGHLAELKTYAGYWLTATLDGYRSSVRRAGLYAALGLVAGLAGAAVVVTAAVLVCLGLSGAISSAAVALLGPGWSWLGPLVVGLLLLGGIGGIGYAMIGRMTGRWRERTVRKYEQLQRQQYADLGHNVRDRATESAARVNGRT